jgi:phenylalanyl-tRNA synthetase alpha chain
MEDTGRLIQSLSPNERKVLPFIGENFLIVCEKSGLDSVAVLRALEYLENKKILKLKIEKKKIVDVAVNGALYRSKGLPERRLLNLVSEKRIISLVDAQKESGLSQDEFRASLGALKKKALIDLKNGKLLLVASVMEVSKKSLEELFLESLPLEFDSLNPEQKFALKSLEQRKNLIEYLEEKKIILEVSALGKKLMKIEIKGDFIEQIDSNLLKKESNWKGKKFRYYDVAASVPGIFGGKRHFVNSAIDYARKVWTEMGFEEMKGNMVQSSFWNFDALFTAQDHPVREMQDTFFLDREGSLPGKKLVKSVSDCHEKGVDGSKGWKYSWDEEEAKKLVLRTHTTCLSANVLANLRKEDLPKKYFSIGKVFRNETVDWSHGFEFYQTEGIVVDPNVNFRQLLGYLKEFYLKMGFEKVRFNPAYFPYTEPSVEIHAWNSERKVWVELGGAGVFRPEISIPLLGTKVPVLAWGLGFDRIITDYYGVKDLRELYKNDIRVLRNKKEWIRG